LRILPLAGSYPERDVGLVWHTPPLYEVRIESTYIESKDRIANNCIYNVFQFNINNMTDFEKVFEKLKSCNTFYKNINIEFVSNSGRLEK